MAILTKNQIIQEIKEKRLSIQPFKSSQIKGASIDLSLGNTFAVFKHQDQAIDVQETTNYHNFIKEKRATTFLVRPGETILAVTHEKITLPDNICGWLEGRSRFARLGLLIHISAGLIHPGVSNHQVLEITNLSPNILKLHSGAKICQLVLDYTSGPIAYHGRYLRQSTI